MTVTSLVTVISLVTSTVTSTSLSPPVWNSIPGWKTPACPWSVWAARPVPLPRWSSGAGIIHPAGFTIIFSVPEASAHCLKSCRALRWKNARLSPACRQNAPISSWPVFPSSTACWRRQKANASLHQAAACAKACFMITMPGRITYPWSQMIFWKKVPRTYSGFFR